jgi:hypothetical protein
MYSTVEVRWFYRGAIPDEVRYWLGISGSPAIQETTRIDTYFCLPEYDDLGIKLRQDRLEIKQRHRHLGELTFSECASGYVEAWRKWSFPLAIADQQPAALTLPTGAWLQVKKIRLLYRFGLGDDRRLLALPPDVVAGPGCEVEASNIWITGQQWWSLAFETFGPESSLEDSLLATAENLLVHKEAPILAARASYGYPSWLARIIKELG